MANTALHRPTQVWVGIFSPLSEEGKAIPACGSQDNSEDHLLGLSGLSDFLRTHILLMVLPLS